MPGYDAQFYDSSATDLGRTSASVVAELALSLVPARSVVDLGCGNGAWSRAFADLGIDDYLGVDGPWVDPAWLDIPAEHFRHGDLATGADLGRAFDLAVSVEVAEHLESSAAEGFVDTLTAHGVKPLLLRRDELTPASGIDAVHSLATRKVPFDALFACSDLLAMGAIRAVQELGRKVPDDVSVVGYDDMPMAAAFQPALSSVRQDWQAGGSLLAQKMLALIRGDEVASQVLPVSLMVRAT